MLLKKNKKNLHPTPNPRAPLTPAESVKLVAGVLSVVTAIFKVVEHTFSCVYNTYITKGDILTMKLSLPFGKKCRSGIELGMAVMWHGWLV